MTRIGVMQVTDTLLPGGLERVAVNLANTLPRDRFNSHLCVTRTAGPLAELVAPHVQQLQLDRRRRFDLSAWRRLMAYIRQNDIRLVHAHGTSLFTAVLTTRCQPFPALIWHDHFGRYATEERPVWLFRLATRCVRGVIAVNQPLADWSRRRLRVPADRVFYIPNFACEPKSNGPAGDLPGCPDSRIVCVANLRREKGHLYLLEAMAQVARALPAAHLLLVGRADDPEYLRQIQEEIRQRNLERHVTWLGPRSDVGSVLKECALGVLSSVSEGLPLALIEYGLAGLPAVATRIGQCAEVLDEGRAGRLVPSRLPPLLAEAILSLLQSPAERERYARLFQERVRQFYSADRIIERICEVYEKVLRPGEKN